MSRRSTRQLSRQSEIKLAVGGGVPGHLPKSGGHGWVGIATLTYFHAMQQEEFSDMIIAPTQLKRTHLAISGKDSSHRLYKVVCTMGDQMLEVILSHTDLAGELDSALSARVQDILRGQLALPDNYVFRYTDSTQRDITLTASSISWLETLKKHGEVTLVVEKQNAHDKPPDYQALLPIDPDMIDVRHFEEKLGGGNFGAVYRAYYSDEPVAVKRMNLEDETSKQNFLAELSALSYVSSSLRSSSPPVTLANIHASFASWGIVFHQNINCW